MYTNPHPEPVSIWSKHRYRLEKMRGMFRKLSGRPRLLHQGIQEKWELLEFMQRRILSLPVQRNDWPTCGRLAGRDKNGNVAVEQKG